MDLLTSCSDCYVSLHRSEGLGLGMAQAMNFAKPVIATGYSGNLEFMNAQNSLLVPFKLVENPESVASYDKGCIWADADLDAAADRMRWVFENRVAAAELGQHVGDCLWVERELAPALIEHPLQGYF